MKRKVISFTLALLLLILPLFSCDVTEITEIYEYTVGNSSFTLDAVSEEFSGTDDTVVRLSILCARSLTEYSVEAKFTMKDGTAILQKEERLRYT